MAYTCTALFYLSWRPKVLYSLVHQCKHTFIHWLRLHCWTPAYNHQERCGVQCLAQRHVNPTGTKSAIFQSKVSTALPLHHGSDNVRLLGRKVLHCKMSLMGFFFTATGFSQKRHISTNVFVWALCASEKRSSVWSKSKQSLTSPLEVKRTDRQWEENWTLLTKCSL